jgi:hypothetical protein
LDLDLSNLKNFSVHVEINHSYLDVLSTS